MVSCYGHVRDLPKNELAVDLEHDFAPSYVVTREKAALVARLTRQARTAREVLLACDSDREGEAIAWHLTEALQLPAAKSKRITFQEITKKAILKAVSAARDIDMDLVNAQQARRVLDRLVGYTLSPLLWKKIRAGLSAGRVQSVAVRLVVEREKLLQEFVPQPYFNVEGVLLLPDGQELTGSISQPLGTYEEVGSFLEAVRTGQLSIEEVSQKSGYSNPPPPLTTAALQQEASSKLGFAVKRTMSLAQRLYEEGYITYMRTDAVTIAEDALQEAAAYIRQEFGDSYHTLRRYEQKSAVAQEAHEAIRPTQLSRESLASEDTALNKLYELIWRRTLGSQMAAAQIDRTVATIGMTGRSEKLEAKGEIITFPGYLALYKTAAGKDRALPSIQAGTPLQVAWMEGKECLTKPSKPRYTEASLVRELEARGIGRPSTYAPIITTIQQRGYVTLTSLPGEEKLMRYQRLEEGHLTAGERQELFGKEKAKLFPTDIAWTVNQYLVHHFPDIINYDYTAHVEEELDQIASSRQEWVAMLRRFYGALEKELKKAQATEESITSPVRELGVHPSTGEKVYARLSRKHGPLLQLGDGEGEKKPRFASLPEGALLSTITLEVALELFAFPRTIGELSGSPVSVHLGKFGPYLKHTDRFYSILPPYTPQSVTLEEAAEIIHAQASQARKQLIRTFPEDPSIEVRVGRFGPYLRTSAGNIKLPREQDPAALSYEEAVHLMQTSRPSAAKGKRKPARKPAT